MKNNISHTASFELLSTSYLFFFRTVHFWDLKRTVITISRSRGRENDFSSSYEFHLLSKKVVIGFKNKTLLTGLRLAIATLVICSTFISSSKNSQLFFVDFKKKIDYKK